MLIKKDGISREVDKNRLQEYLDKGYKPVEKKPEKKPAKGA